MTLFGDPRILFATREGLIEKKRAARRWVAVAVVIETGWPGALAAFNSWGTERRMHKDAVRRQRAYYYERGIPQLQTFAGPLIEEFYRPAPNLEPSPPPIVSEREAMEADIEAANRRLEVAHNNHSGV